MKNRSQRKISFLVVLFGWGLFMSADGQGKAKPLRARDSGDRDFPLEMLKNKPADFSAGYGFYPLPGENGLFVRREDAFPKRSPDQKADPEPAYLSSVFIPANTYYCQSGFFCKREWDLEKATHIPIRFRLGSLDYCNVLEGKQRPGPF